MAFPGTYNISYYRGDTLEFNVYPKDSDGNDFSLTDYTARFVVADKAGPDQDISIDKDPVVNGPNAGNFIACVIEPDEGDLLLGGQTYVYDLEISKPASGLEGSYPFVYTILTGSISVTEQVAIEPQES